MRENEQDMKTWKSIFLGIVIGFLAGVGTMQATLIGDVRDHTVRLQQISVRNDKDMDSISLRIERITRLMESILESNRQLLSELSAERRRSDK